MEEYLRAIKDVADLLRMKLPAGTPMVGYLNDLITPSGYIISYDDKREEHVIKAVNKYSRKGKDFHGKKLTENSKLTDFVQYKGNIYETGNRYHDLVELYKDAVLFYNVYLKDIRLIRNK